MLCHECQLKLLEEIKQLCDKYRLRYLRHCQAGDLLTGVEVYLSRPDWVFWVEQNEIRLSSEPWKIKPDELVRIATFSHRVSGMLEKNWKENKS